VQEGADEEMQDSTGGAVVAQSSPRKPKVRSPQEKPPNPHAPKISRPDNAQSDLTAQRLKFAAAAE
jgi:hypothetical protein